jgi:hypothetical protein
MATLMLAGVVGLSLWDYERWRPVIAMDETRPARAQGQPPIDWALWRGCGAGILVLYLGVCAYAGGIYRPKGVDAGNPAFYIFPIIALFPVATLMWERRRRRRSTRA